MATELHSNAISTVEQYLHNNQVDQAVHTAQELLNTQPSSHASHFVMGLVSKKTGFFDKAKLHFIRASSLNPEFLRAKDELANTYYEIANERFHEGKKSIAIQCCKSALRLKPDDLSSHLLVTKIFIESNDFVSAAPHLSFVLQNTQSDTREQLFSMCSTCLEHIDYVNPTVTLLEKLWESDLVDTCHAEFRHFVASSITLADDESAPLLQPKDPSLVLRLVSTLAIRNQGFGYFNSLLPSIAKASALISSYFIKTKSSADLKEYFENLPWLQACDVDSYTSKGFDEVVRSLDSYSHSNDDDAIVRWLQSLLDSKTRETKPLITLLHASINAFAVMTAKSDDVRFHLSLFSILKLLCSTAKSHCLETDEEFGSTISECFHCFAEIMHKLGPPGQGHIALTLYPLLLDGPECSTLLKSLVSSHPTFLFDCCKELLDADYISEHLYFTEQVVLPLSAFGHEAAKQHYTALRAVNRHDLSAELFPHVYESRETDAQYFEELCEHLSALGMTAELEDICRDRIEAIPNDLIALQSLGEILMGREIYDEAEFLFKRILKIEDDQADPHRLLGHCLLSQGKATQAYDHFELGSQLALEQEFPFLHLTRPEWIEFLDDFRKKNPFEIVGDRSHNTLNLCITPRCGTTTVQEMFHQLYKPWQYNSTHSEDRPQLAISHLSKMPDERKNTMLFFHNHLNPVVPFREFGSNSISTILFFRDPIRCFTSSYQWATQHRDKSWVIECVKEGKSFDTYVEKRIAGGYSNTFCKTVLSQYDYNSSLYEGDDAALMAKAQDLVKSNSTFCGITEYFCESCFVLFALLGLDRIPFWRRRASSGPSMQEEYAPGTMEKIRAVNGADVALYKFLNDHFLEQYEEIIAFFRREIGSLEYEKYTGFSKQ